MRKYTNLPAIKGSDLIKLLQKDSWNVHGYGTHGVVLWKQFGDRKRVTIVPKTNASLPDGTLSAILGQKQTHIGKEGLLVLINKYGL